MKNDLRDNVISGSSAFKDVDGCMDAMTLVLVSWTGTSIVTFFFTDVLCVNLYLGH